MASGAGQAPLHPTLLWGEWTVLEGLVAALHAPLCLWVCCMDYRDIKLVTCTLTLSQLVAIGVVRVNTENTAKINVECMRPFEALDIDLRCLHLRFDRFGRYKLQPDDLADRIIDKYKQRTAWTSPFEPIVWWSLLMIDIIKCKIITSIFCTNFYRLASTAPLATWKIIRQPHTSPKIALVIPMHFW